MFASRSLTVHLVRGVLALAAIAAAILLLSRGAGGWAGAAAIGLAIGALLLLRGCPMCWLVGLIETARGRRA